MNYLARSSLHSAIRCPDCGMRVGYEASDAEAPSTGTPKCIHCNGRWWLMALALGSVEPQLARVFGDEIARDLMWIYKLPVGIDRPLWWHLRLSRSFYESHGRAGSRVLMRALLASLRGMTPMRGLAAGSGKQR